MNSFAVALLKKPTLTVRFNERMYYGWCCTFCRRPVCLYEELQSAGNAIGVVLATFVSARGFVVAAALCCVVYIYDARKQPNQWLRENPPACSAGSGCY